jgi:hypothetical protein
MWHTAWVGGIQASSGVHSKLAISVFIFSRHTGIIAENY